MKGFFKKAMPYLIGVVVGVFLARSKKGSELLSKVPFLKKAEEGAE